MPRTTAELVAGIIEVQVTIPLEPFILPANELVTEICVPAGYTDERLELIERYLSAHIYTLRDPRPVSQTAGPVSETYQSRVDLYLCTSHYGQMAMMLDTAGGLRDLNSGKKKTKLSVSWLGSESEDRTPLRTFTLPDV